MTIALMVITDSPRLAYLDKTIRSADAHLKGNITERVIVCDGDRKYCDKVWQRYCAVRPENSIYQYSDYLWAYAGAPNRMGFAGAIQRGWDYVKALPPKVTHVLHCEADFTFNQDVDVDDMVAKLEDEQYPGLAQVALMRQPWNLEEKIVGGVVQLHPEDFTECNGLTLHTRFWTTNPCIYRRDLLDRGWPQEAESEGKWGITLREEGWVFGYYQPGGKFEPPRVTHIGEERNGIGY